MPKRSSKLPTDTNQKAHAIVALATSETTAPEPAQPTEPEKNPAAVALGKLGGAKGGPARAKSLSKKRRSEIAKRAAKARWSKNHQ